ncbi:hypothetical protein EDC94DRAFT_692681 [Helicostylum pulchrum]|nr:hypothetical protein EDC94DRAFT_692681 [Helicostylum pulchrum]
MPSKSLNGILPPPESVGRGISRQKKINQESCSCENPVNYDIPCYHTLLIYDVIPLTVVLNRWRIELDKYDNVTIDPTKPRIEAIQLLEDDLKVLGAAFVDSKESKVIIGLRTALRNQNDALDHFWHTSYPELQKNAIDYITNVDKVEAGLEEEAVERSQSKKRMNTQPETKDHQGEMK